MDYYSSVGETLLTHEGRDAFVRLHITHGWTREGFKRLVKKHFKKQYESLLMHTWHCVTILDSQRPCKPSLFGGTVIVHEQCRKRNDDLMSLLIHSWWCLSNMDHSHTRIAKQNSALAAHVPCGGHNCWSGSSPATVGFSQIDVRYVIVQMRSC